VPEPTAHTHPEEQKRRSTRIVQAVPLTVSGVDALGRPFQERTSTVVINCHGCRYQSKHYVLKNMWVTLEVPHPEADREPRSVRAKIVWIQRPRTVRELFHIGAELEVPGNVWGIAFPPEDWFAFPETVAPELPSLAAQTEAEASFEEGALPGAAPDDSNVRVLPGPGGPEASLALARHVARLVVEAKQQIQNAVREATAKAVGAEVRPMLAAIQSQLSEAAEKAVQGAVASHADQVLRQTTAGIDEAGKKATNAAREEWNREIERRTEEARQQLLSLALENQKKLDSVMNAAVDSTGERIHRLHQQVEESAEAAKRRLQETTEGRVEGAQARLEKLEQAARHLNDKIEQTITAAESGWRAHLNADLGAVGTRWNEKIEASLERTAQLAAERLAQRSQEAAQQLGQELNLRVTALRQSLEQTTAAAESTLSTLRATLDTETVQAKTSLHQALEEASKAAESALSTLSAAVDSETARAKASLVDTQQAVRGLEESAARLDALSQATVQGLQRRFEGALDAQSAELNRRAESAAAGMAERLQPVLEAAGQQSLARLAAQLEQQLAPQLERATELAQKLAMGQGQAEEVLLVHQQRLQKASEQTLQEATARLSAQLEQKLTPQLEQANAALQKLAAVQEQAEEGLRAHQLHLQQVTEQSAQEATAHLQETLRRFEKDFQEAGRVANAQRLAELEEKATDTLHTTYEALYKAAQWYEKKAQSQIQATLDKGLEQASNGLREKAGEISSLFASELNHYSRNYVEHAQGQMDEAAKEAFERARTHLTQAAETTAATFSDNLHNAAQREFERFTSSAASAFEQTAAQLEAHTAQVRSKIDAEARRFFVDFHKGMTQEIQQTVAQAGQDLEAQVMSAKEGWRTQREAQERQLRDALARLGEDSIDAYRKRLENASNAWLVAAVTTLTQQSEDAIGTLANSAERQLRQTCAQVFADLGETLRQRLLELSKLLPDTAPPLEKK